MLCGPGDEEMALTLPGVVLRINPAGAASQAARWWSNKGTFSWSDECEPCRSEDDDDLETGSSAELGAFSASGVEDAGPEVSEG